MGLLQSESISLLDHIVMVMMLMMADDAHFCVANLKLLGHSSRSAVRQTDSLHFCNF